MHIGICIFLAVSGALFGLKIIYVLCTTLILPFTRGALYVSTSPVRISAFLDAVPMRAGQVFVDMGCGDGRVLRKVRKRYRVRAVGYELNLLAYISSRIRCFGLREVEINWANFWKADLSYADVVFCYLFPDVMEELAVRLKRDLKPGSVVVSCNFNLPGFIPEQVLRLGNPLHNDPIYVYRMP